MTHYKIRVLEVGYVEQYPADFCFDGYYLAGETIFSPFSMTLLQGGGKNILVDSGIDLRNPAKQEIFSMAGAANGHAPDEVLGTVGLTPEDIDAVIMTHLHWDHASGAACYPKAVFYLQREELERWEEASQKPAWSAFSLLSMDFRDLDVFRSLKDQGRLVLLDGETDGLFPGISIRVSRFAHSFASQMVLVWSGADVFVVAGDVCNRPENLLGTADCPFFLPNPKFSVGGAANTVRDYERILDWAGGDADRVVMTHDGTRHGRFPETTTALGLSVYEICP